MVGVPAGFHRVNFNCPDDLFEAVKAKATPVKRKVSTLMVQLLRDYLAISQDLPSHPDELPEDVRVAIGTQTAKPPPAKLEEFSSRLM